MWWWEETAHNFKGAESIYLITWQEVDDDAEREPKIGQSEPREDEGENIILQISPSVNRDPQDKKKNTYQGLQMQEEHADNAMTGFIKHKEVHKSVLIKTRNQGLKTIASQNYTHNRSRKRTI